MDTKTRLRGLGPAELALLDEAFWAQGTSREALAARSGTTMARGLGLVAELVVHGVLEDTGQQPSAGERPPERLRLAHRLGVVAGVDLGVTSLDVALMTPDLQVLAQRGEPCNVAAGPGAVMARVRQLIHDLMAMTGVPAGRLLAIGVGVPGPVDVSTERLVEPPLLPAWDGYAIREDLLAEFDVPVAVENDVNLMALGELWRLQRTLEHFVVVKVGTGIGCGIVCNGRVYRGANGSAGDVGHLVVDPQGPRCHCGNAGCVEAMAAGPAIARAAAQAARDGRSEALAAILAERRSLSAEDVGHAARAGDPAAAAIVQHAGQLVGQMVATVVNVFNPSHVFLGGAITRLGPPYLAAVRQSVHERSLALSRRHLQIQTSPLGDQAGRVGAGVLAMQMALRPGGAAAPNRRLAA